MGIEVYLESIKISDEKYTHGDLKCAWLHKREDNRKQNMPLDMDEEYMTMEEYMAFVDCYEEPAQEQEWDI